MNELSLYSKKLSIPGQNCLDNLYQTCQPQFSIVSEREREGGAVYTQLSLSLSASISGVLALIICMKLSSHSPSGLSNGSLLSSLTQLRLSWRELGEKIFLLLVLAGSRLTRLLLEMMVMVEDNNY